MALLLPSSFEYADYASELRTKMRRLFRGIEVFRCSEPLFPGVLEGSIVLVCYGYRETGEQFAAVDCPTKATLDEALAAPPMSAGNRAAYFRTTNQSDGVPLRDLVRIRIGAVTGDTRYFVISERERLEAGLPKRALRPVIGRSNHLRGASIGKQEWSRLLRQGERVWLFRPTDSIVKHEAVQRYLALPTDEGGCRRGYKTARREPWFLTPIPRRPDGFISGMATSGPWICFSDLPTLTATNTLYVVSLRSRSEAQLRGALGLSLLTSMAQSQLASRVRRYADGLRKTEPGALLDVRVPCPLPRPDVWDVYTRAISLLLDGQGKTARAIADEYYDQPTRAG